MEGHKHHPVSPVTVAAAVTRGSKRRGSYNCGKCGLPKKGHVCHLTSDAANPNTPAPDPYLDSVLSSPSSSVVSTPPLRQTPSLRRALSFDDVEVVGCSQVMGDDDEVEVVELDDFDGDGSGRFPASCLWEVLKRLPPEGLMSASGVCRGWRDTVRLLWREAEELRLRVPAGAQIGFVGSVLQKCCSLVRLSLRMESDIDSTTLACIAFSCPDLVSLEIFISSAAVNRITGEKLSRFVAERRCLTSLKVEGCLNLGNLVLSSNSLSMLWLSDLYCIPKMIFNCPNLKEISLDFSRQENDSTNLTNMVDCLGRSCPRLQKIHISSVRLSHAVVLALTAANFRGLRMLSLVLGAEITDASVAAIASSYTTLESLDLSGSGISDCGIGIICNVLPDTLLQLLLALCPNITSSGIQFAAAQLPLLELMDCGMTICDPNMESEVVQDESNSEIQKPPNNKLHLIFQNLTITHTRLKKLSLWGCSGLDGLYLNCPKLVDLNLNSCINLHPERLLLQCSGLETVHASGCRDKLINSVQSQVCSGFSEMENHLACRRLPDGSKRVGVPLLVSSEMISGDKKKRRRISKNPCNVIVN